jgi:glucose/arabinose dehydrogenase
MLRSLAASAVLLLVACSTPSPTPAQTPGGSGVGSAPGASSPAMPSASAEATQAPPRRVPQRLALEKVADGLESPIGITNAGDGSGRLFVNEQGGRVRVIEADGTLRPEPFLDISDRLVAGGERGFLGLAFHPGFEANGRLFVHYSRAGDGATVVSEIQARPDHQSADPGSERVLFTVAQPYVNHNGGQLAFGPDGYLYIGLGDGGAGGDPLGNGQNRRVLLGKILRIDIDGEAAPGRAYGIPRDNPYAAEGIDPGGGLPEIWAYGLRNPWRFSFDPENGDLYIGDVGQSAYEEIDRAAGDSRGGENYGWNVMEGRHCYAAEACDQDDYVKPIAEYSRRFGCSVIGGFVYRGSDFPELQGIYVFADYCSGIMFALNPAAGPAEPRQLLETDLSIAAFGTDEDGELYLVDRLGGTVQRVTLPD